MNDTNILIYQTEDGQTSIETKMLNETVWLNQEQMAKLFQKSRSTINEHIKNIYEDAELSKSASMKKFGNPEFAKKPTNYYNLDLIISVGYRVRSEQGTKFRQWATARLSEYLVKGFTMNDEFLKNAGSNHYFEELLARIRDIRSSEKVFWRKVLDIYATSVDYDAKANVSISFFQTIQNKMHWAAHGNTAAEVIYQRVDSTKQNMGLTSFKGSKPTKKEIQIAKNYLDENELHVLNRIVTAYLEMAELQALNQKPMYMKDWIEKLDDFLKMTGNDILKNAGKISHKNAMKKVEKEYEHYKIKFNNDLSRVEHDYIERLEDISMKLKKGTK